MPWISHRVCRKKSKTRENGTNKERLEDGKEIHIEENPNAILAIQNLQCRQRRQSDTPSDSSLESADEKLLKLEVCKQFQSQKRIDPFYSHFFGKKTSQQLSITFHVPSTKMFGK